MRTEQEPPEQDVTVESPYRGRRLSIGSQVVISSYWLATNVLWGAILAQVLPGQIEAITAYYKKTLAAPTGTGVSGWLATQFHILATEKGPALGVIGSAVAIVSLIVPLVVGPMSDRCMSRWGRRRPYVAFGSGLSIAALVLMYLAGASQGLWFYMAAYCFVALGNNIATAAYFGIIPDLIPDDQRGIASGYMAVMSQVGTAIGVFAGKFKGAHDTYFWAYVGVVVAIAAITVLTMYRVKENPLPVRPPKLDFRSYLRKVLMDPWKHRDFLWVWITRFLVMLGFYAVEPYIKYYLHDVIRVENAEEATFRLLVIILIGSTISGMVGGYVSEKIGRKKVVYASNVVIAAMCVALMFCRTLNEALFVGVLFGLGYGAYISVDWALGTDVLPSKEDVGKDMAVWHISMTLPQSVTPLIAGAWLLPAFGSKPYILDGETKYAYQPGGYVLVFGMAALFFILGAVFLRNVKKAR